ncbi:MAG: SRPBCC family protein [Solirubrobacterales bacterium]
MASVSRRRMIEAPPSEVWSLISDPHNLPRWWPHTERVEDVERTKAGRRSRWTKVLRTKGGRGVRADFRCTGSTEESRFAWEQEIAGTPFERHLRSSEVEILLQPGQGGTEVRITSRHALKGLSRLGSPMLSRGQGTILTEALDGVQRALEGPAREDES